MYVNALGLKLRGPTELIEIFYVSIQNILRKIAARLLQETQK